MRDPGSLPQRKNDMPVPSMKDVKSANLLSFGPISLEDPHLEIVLLARLGDPTRKKDGMLAAEKKK
jgi:hypothetical protein